MINEKKKKRKQKERQKYNAMKKKYSANNSWLLTYENVKSQNRHKQNEETNNRRKM